MEKIKGVTVRFLNETERDISTQEAQTPLVIESQASGKNVNFPEFLRENSNSILHGIALHGAVLLRNFDVNSESDFEKSLTNIEGLHIMNDYFLREDGRSLIEGSKHVFYTNKNFKTGGTFRFGGFHNENYCSTDVPGFIAFCCFKAPKLGGETGLVHMGKVYNDLNVELKRKLEAQTFPSNLSSISEIASRYSISTEEAKNICSQFGISIEPAPNNEDSILYLYKPVVISLENRPPALICNLSQEISKLDNELFKQFRSDYSGWRWLLHNIYWNYTKSYKFGTITIRKFRKLLSLEFPNKKAASDNTENRNKLNSFLENRLNNVFTDEDINNLSKSMRNHFSSFRWKVGDILIIDNLQMAHSGMPGLGARTLRAIICNPIPLKQSVSSPGRQTIKKDEEFLPLVVAIENLKKCKQQ